MKKRGYRLITGALLIGWMIIIFWFSAQPAMESQEMSGGVAYRVMSACDRIFDADMSAADLMQWAERIDYPIRKLAHMSEYALLAIFSGACLLGYREWDKKTICGSLVLSAGYAVTDEIHQLFVSGRAGRFSDVCIDTFGAAIGLVFFAIMLKLVRNHCEKKRLLLK